MHIFLQKKGLENKNTGLGNAKIAPEFLSFVSCRIIFKPKSIKCLQLFAMIKYIPVGIWSY